MARKRNTVDHRRKPLDEARDARREFALDRALRCHDALDRHRLRLAELPAAQAELSQQQFRDLLGVRWFVHPESRAALNHSAMKKIFRRRHREQSRDFLPATRLTEDRNRPRIAAELR